MSVKRVGFVVNPIAGMGGKVGLKGTDGPEVLEKARELGSEPGAPDRAVSALKKLREFDIGLELLTCSGVMGEDEAMEGGFTPEVVMEIEEESTDPEDTRKVVKIFEDRKVDMIMFAGGDGTARDVIGVVGAGIPVLGIPTGVKMHSAVFANTPEIAGKLGGRYLSGNLPLREAEVMDVDEEAFRNNKLETDLKGFGRTPYDPRWIQAAKSPTTSSGSERDDQRAIAQWVVEKMEGGKIYILGPGTTTRAIAEELDISDFTLLGVDLVRDGEIFARDVTEERILEELEGCFAEIFVSPIGKQGFILGRGNQQVSPKVIRKVGKGNVLILATPNKLAETPMLKVDTGDPELDEEFRGYARVWCGYRTKRPVPVA